MHDFCNTIPSFNLKIDNMRKIILVLAVPLLLTLTSCLKNENSIIYSDAISLSVGPLIDTAVINTQISLPFRATAPNACWRDIKFVHVVEKDSILKYGAVATFENHGENCADVIQIKDSVFKYTPTTLKPLVVYIYSVNETTGLPEVKNDTIFVKAAK